MLLRCCLIYITIITLRRILHLVYLRSCLDLGLFIMYLCDPYIIFSSLTFVVINHITLLKWRHLFFVHFQNISYCFWVITWTKKANNFQFAQVQHWGVAYKSIAYKKGVYMICRRFLYFLRNQWVLAITNDQSGIHSIYNLVEKHLTECITSQNG